MLARLAGASALTAANIGLVAAVVLLTVHGWAAGPAAKLRGLQPFFTASIVAAPGLVMVTPVTPLAMKFMPPAKLAATAVLFRVSVKGPVGAPMVTAGGAV